MNTFGLSKLPNGKGGFGQCYIINNDLLYKKFYKQDDKTYPFDADYFDKFIGIESDNFVFPLDVDTHGGYTVGYTMDYVHADTLEVLDFDFSIDDFIVALDKLKKGLYQITDQGIVVCDVNAKNMLYDGEFHVIDTDLYQLEYESDFVPEEVNEDYVARYLHGYVTQERRPSEIEKLKMWYYDLECLDKSLTKNATIEDLKMFLYELKYRVSTLDGTNIETFNDLYDEITKIR